MYTYKNLYPFILDEKNTLQAIKDVVAKKDKNNRVVKFMIEHPEITVRYFYTWLFSQNRKPFIHKARMINDGYKAKKRMVMKPFLRTEQILQHLIVMALKDMFYKGMYDLSCGSIPDRGPLFAKRHVEKFIREHPKDIKYVLQADIYHFYESIDIDLLKERFAKHIKDDDFLELVYFVLDSNGGILDGELIKSGLPIGFYSSQWFANWFLQPFDHYVKEQLGAKFYVRYMDDILIFDSNKKKLHKIRIKIEEYLKTLNLELKGNYQVFRFDYLKNGKHTGRLADFMGFKFYRDRTTIRSKIFLRARRKAKRSRQSGKCTWRDASQIMSYFGYFKHTNTYNAFQKYLAPNINLKSLKAVARKHSKEISKQENLKGGRYEN